MAQRQPQQHHDDHDDDDDDDMEAPHRGLLKEQRNGVVIIKISVHSFIQRMYCTMWIVFLSTVIGTSFFFVKVAQAEGGGPNMRACFQVFLVVGPIYFLALVLLSQFKDMFPSNILLMMLLTSLSTYLGGYLTNYWQTHDDPSSAMRVHA